MTKTNPGSSATTGLCHTIKSCPECPMQALHVPARSPGGALGQAAAGHRQVQPLLGPLLYLCGINHIPCNTDIMRSKQNEAQGYTELTLHSTGGLGVAAPTPGIGARGHRCPFSSASHKTSATAAGVCSLARICHAP